MNILFLAGAPGSRWSGVSQRLGLMPGVDHSDEVDHRVYKHSQFSGHKGIYFGPGMELGKNFERLPELSRNEIESEIALAYGSHNSEELRIVKAHVFSYHLDALKQKFPESRIMVVWRENATCLDWWLQIGGFKIPYPRYDWYLNEENMKKKLAEENLGIQNFVKRHKLQLELFTPQWIERNFGHKVTFDAPGFFDDVYVAVK